MTFGGMYWSRAERHFEILRRTCLRQTRFGVPETFPPKIMFAKCTKRAKFIHYDCHHVFFSFFLQLHSSQKSVLTVRSRSAKYYYLLSMHKMYISLFLQVSSSPTKFFLCVCLSFSKCELWVMGHNDTSNTPFLIFLCVCSHFCYNQKVKLGNWPSFYDFTLSYSCFFFCWSWWVPPTNSLFLCPFFTKLSSFSLLSLLTKLTM